MDMNQSDQFKPIVSTNSGTIVWKNSRTSRAEEEVLTEAVRNGNLNRWVKSIDIDSIPPTTIVGYADMKSNETTVSTLVIRDNIIEQYGKVAGKYERKIRRTLFKYTL